MRCARGGCAARPRIDSDSSKRKGFPVVANRALAWWWWWWWLHHCRDPDASPAGGGECGPGRCGRARFTAMACYGARSCPVAQRSTAFLRSCLPSLMLAGSRGHRFDLAPGSSAERIVRRPATPSSSWLSLSLSHVLTIACVRACMHGGRVLCSRWSGILLGLRAVELCVRFMPLVVLYPVCAYVLPAWAEDLWHRLLTWSLRHSGPCFIKVRFCPTTTTLPWCALSLQVNNIFSTCLVS
jgi:hypothetical protein